jgi:hypothetical protein
MREKRGREKGEKGGRPTMKRISLGRLSERRRATGLNQKKIPVSNVRNPANPEGLMSTSYAPKVVEKGWGK